VRTHLESQGELRYREAVNCLVSLDAGGYSPRETLFSKLKESYPSFQQSAEHLVETFYQQFFCHMSLEEETQWLLDALGQAGMPFGIVTNGSYRQKRKIEVLGLDKLTSCIFISEVFGCKKPEAKIFLAAASCLGSIAEQVLFVGDNPYADIWGAQDFLFLISRSRPLNYMKHQTRNSRNHEEVDLVGGQCITRNRLALS